MKINLEKLNHYLKNGDILEFESDDECLEHFTVNDHQLLKTINELKRFQGKYGFNIGKRRYHINAIYALDVREENFSDDEVDIIRDGIIALIHNSSQAIRLTRNEKAKDILRDENGRYRELINKLDCL